MHSYYSKRVTFVVFSKLGVVKCCGNFKMNFSRSKTERYLVISRDRKWNTWNALSLFAGGIPERDFREFKARAIVDFQVEGKSWYQRGTSSCTDFRSFHSSEPGTLLRVISFSHFCYELAKSSIFTILKVKRENWLPNIPTGQASVFNENFYATII